MAGGGAYDGERLGSALRDGRCGMLLPLLFALVGFFVFMEREARVLDGR